MIESVEVLPTKVSAPAAPSDAALLSGYAQSGAETIFSAIVDRHSKMVYSVCLRILGEAHAAEDAAQATFLVLTRRARSLPRQTNLSGWLYVTAQNTAHAVKRAAQRRARHEREVATMTRSPADEAWEDVRDKLDHALAALPEAQRDALVLRYMNGLSEIDAAREMGCSERTLHTRVTRGLARLRDKLCRRGTGISLSVLVLILSTRMNEIPPAGMAATIKAVCVGKAVTAPAVIAAANTALATVAWSQLKILAFALVAMTLTGSLAYFAISGRQAGAPVASMTATAEVHPVQHPAGAARAQSEFTVPLRSNPASFENHDGQHLNDRAIWKPMGELPLDAADSEVSVHVANPDAERWRSGGLLNHTAWDLSKYTVSIKVTSSTCTDCDTTFFGLCYFLIDGSELNDPVALERALKNGGEFNPGQFVGVKRTGEFATRVSELVLSNTEAVLTVDGRSQHIPFEQPAGGAFIGFRAGARNCPAAHVFSVRDVVISKKEIAAPAEKF